MRERSVLHKFDPVIRGSDYYRRRWSFIGSLFGIVFVIAGAVAFYFDSVTLPGRSVVAEFSGKDAHGAGVVCFFIAAHAFYNSLKEYRVSLFVLLSPFLVATAVSAALMAIKYG